MKARPSAITIDKPIDEVFAFARDFSNFPLFAKGVQQVESLSSQRTRWTIGEGDSFVIWECAIEAEEPERLLAWQSVDEEMVPHNVVMTFAPAPADQGTVVTLQIDGNRAPGRLSEIAAYFLGKDSRNQSAINLRRLKAYLETGEVPSIEGQPSGREELT